MGVWYGWLLRLLAAGGVGAFVTSRETLRASLRMTWIAVGVLTLGAVLLARKSPFWAGLAGSGACAAAGCLFMYAKFRDSKSLINGFKLLWNDAFGPAATPENG